MHNLQRLYVDLAVSSAVEGLRDELIPLAPDEVSSVVSIVAAVRMIPDGDRRVPRAEALRVAVDLLRHAGLDAARRRLERTRAELDANRAAKAAKGQAP